MPDYKLLKKENVNRAIEELLEGESPRPPSKTYDVVHNGARVPPKLVIQRAFQIVGEDVTIKDFKSGASTTGFNHLRQLGFEIKRKNEVDISELLKLFVDDVRDEASRTWYYPKQYQNYIMKTSFGQGALAQRPWIAIRKEGQEIQNGIYPVYLYYKTSQKIVLAYGVSEDNIPNSSWNLGDKAKPISQVIPEDDPGETKCGYVHSVYNIQDNQLPDVDFKKDLASILDDYENKVIINEPEEIHFETLDMNIQKNTILYGPPGTGKTYNTVKYIQDILEDNSTNANIKSLRDNYSGRVEFVTFHQNFSYEDFVEGLRPDTDENGNLTYSVQPGVFKQICDNVEPGKPSVLVIDEINRGNIARIFGELITLIEDTKRVGEPEELELTLPYSKDPFSVPRELYIVATMNTADRSLVMLDTALRRRFNFVEMTPNPSLLNSIEDINCSSVLTTINQRIEQSLDKDHTLGHSFFMKCSTVEDLMRTFDNKILPLLEEYFFDDFTKLNPILNNKFYANIDLDTTWANDDVNLEGSSLRRRRDIFEDKTLFSDALKSLYE